MRFVLALAFAAATQVAPSEPEEPFAVFVFTDAPSSANDKNSIVTTTEEVGKKIRDRKKWFRLVDSREDADIVVEVVHQTEGQGDRRHIVRRPDNADPSDPQMANFMDVTKGFTLETKVHLPGADPMDMNVSTDGKRPRDTAKPYARQLQSFCRLNYWTLMKALKQ